jgi:protease I
MARVAFVVGADFEDSEFRVPYDRLKGEGHELTIVGVKKGEELRGKKGKEKIRVEASGKDVKADDFDAVVVPGGYGPDHLRVDREVVNFVRNVGVAGKPVAAVCHGPSLLIEADLVEGKHVTSWPSIHTDLVNAGAHWADEQVVEDGNLITSRNPGDLEAFSGAIVARLKQKVPAPA